MKESYGNLITLKELGNKKSKPFTLEQILDENLKNEGGESRKEVTARMEKIFNKIFRDNTGKRIAIVSHGAAIKFLLMKWCKLNNEDEIQYNEKVIKLNSPGIIKLVFNDNNLIELKQIL